MSTSRLSSSALARSRKPRAGTDVLCERVYRPLAHLVVLALLPLRVPPPAVVLASGATGVAGSGRARARTARRRGAPHPAEDRPRQRGRSARAAVGTRHAARPLPRLGMRPRRRRGALRGARLVRGRTGRCVVGFVMLTAVLSVNFNLERLYPRRARARARGARAHARARSASTRTRTAGRTELVERSSSPGCAGHPKSALGVSRSSDRRSAR